MSHLNAKRKELHITQAMMASKIGIGVSTYCMYENGHRHIPEDIALQIADILSVDVDDIFKPTLYKVLNASE